MEYFFCALVRPSTLKHHRRQAKCRWIYGFIVFTKTDDIYKDFAEGVKTRFDTSNYELDRPLAKAKNKKVFKLMKDKLGGKIMAKSVGLRAKT